jgi:hypothetical protein
MVRSISRRRLQAPDIAKYGINEAQTKLPAMTSRMTECMLMTGHFV